MRPFDWQRDLHPSMTWLRGTTFREPPFSVWWTSERIGIAALVWGLCCAFLIGVAVGS